ncbi:hypothetical protein U3516DRAFT_744651 [Neocallimastix sp. 'constans']
MQLGEMQHFNTTPLGEMQFGEMQLSLYIVIFQRLRHSSISNLVIKKHNKNADYY